MSEPSNNRPLTGVNNDLGLGGKFSRSTSVRLLNQDGTFNAHRIGYGRLHPINLYHTLIEMRPRQIVALSLVGYVLLNALFALLYYACGPDAINFQGTEHIGRLESCFYFSVQTIGTIGYGKMVPVSRAANLLVALEALFGLIGFAVLSALIYARFTRPRAEILFSNRAVLAPYEGGWALMLRLANKRRSDLTDARATVTLSYWKSNAQGGRERVFEALELERSRVVFMPLHWVVVHPIGDNSPLHKWAPKTMQDAEPEIFILLTADDETFAMTVHARTSYRREEIVWGAKFDDMYRKHPTKVVVDLGLIHSYTMLAEAPTEL